MNHVARHLRTAALAVGLLAVSTTLLLASGWESETCGARETWNGEDCELIWCVNANSAFYACPIATHKSCPEGDCRETGVE